MHHSHYTHSQISKICNDYLRKHKYTASFVFEILFCKDDKDTFPKSDWIVFAKDENFDYADLDVSPFAIYIIENPFRIWHSEGF